MAHMVFIREVDPNSFLHLSVKQSSFRLRAYPGPNVPSREVRQQGNGCYAQNIFEMAAHDGNMLLDAPSVPHSDSQFWYDHIQKLNKEHLKTTKPPSDPSDSTSIKIDIKKGGKLVGVLKVSKATITWYPNGQQIGSRLSLEKFSELIRQHGQAVGN